MHPQLTKLKGMTRGFFFPQHCLGCGKAGELLCYTCCQSLPQIKPPVCPRCGKPRADGTLCSSCTGWNTALEGIRSPLRFEGIVRTAIHQFKYNNIRALAKPLSIILKDYFHNNTLPGEVLVPVPMHPARIRERGYNQSGLLAHELGGLIGLPVNQDCLVRSRITLPQIKTVNVDERRKNVDKAFTCRNQALRGKQVILIDDVSTSGSTLNACAFALKEAGAGVVWGLTLTREI